MTKKTVKSLDAELVKLKTEFDDMKVKCDELLTKYECLEKKCEEKDSEKNVEFNCKRCAEKFTKICDLKKHERTHNLMKCRLECKDCGKTFNEEWKLDAHVKTHKVYSCDQCDNKFNCEDIKDKHVKIAHGNIKLYCCFYNNDVECLYESSGASKFGRKCVRINCLYQNKIYNTNENRFVEDDINQKDDDNDKCDRILEIDDEESIEESSSEESVHESDQTFLNPSQSDEDDGAETDIKETNENDDIEKTENLEEVEYKCELCIFKTKDSKRFARHTVEIHSIKGKYLCSGRCKRQFDNRKEFNNHNYHGC